MDTQLVINSNEVWKEVETHQAYQAAKNSPAYNSKRIKKSDRELFDIYFAEAKNQLTQSFIAFIRQPKPEEQQGSANEGDTIFYLDLKDFPAQLVDSLTFYAKRVCIYYALTRWLTMLSSSDEVAKAAASDAAGLCANYRDSIQRLLMRRNKPYKLKAFPF